MSQWIPLHQHSQYSILDASCSIEQIVGKATQYQMSACALTDHGNLFGAVDFYKSCKLFNIKPLIGCEVYVAPNSRLEKKKEGKKRVAHHLTLIAKNTQGYQNLCQLVSLGYLEGFYYFPRIDKELLEKYHEGLICLSGCLSSEISQKIISRQDISEAISWYQHLFGEDYYLEIQRHTMSQEKIQQLDETWLVHEYEEYIEKQILVNTTLIDTSKKMGIELVATNDTHYIDEGDWQAHEVLLNIQSGEPIEIYRNSALVKNPKRRIYPSREFYFKTPKQMEELFSDLPQSVTNTLKVAQKCCFEMDFSTKHYPVYSSKEMKTDAFSYLEELCHQNIEKRYPSDMLVHVKEKHPDKDPLKVIQERLAYELQIIHSKGLSDYLLIVWDFIHWAKTHQIPVGPGRGSGAGSVVLYLIGITDIEPLRFNLFFERFINPERSAYPDIDVDICMSRRNEVIEYTVQKYGSDCVAQIITFGTMKAKMTIKDTGRVFSVPLTKVNAWAKLLGDDLNLTLDKALESHMDFQQLYQEDAQAKRIIDLGRKIEGSIRNTGIHAAGIIVSAKPLVQQIPICVSKDADMVVTQYAMKQVESVGMLKIDFLGLKTLTCIQLCVDAIKKYENKSIDWVHLDLEDVQTFKLLQKGSTLGVFQMESSGMQDLSKQLRPDKFEEIIAIGALYRPGPMDMIPSFIARKHGREQIIYDHPQMASSLAETYGIIVYQEQVMQIASQLAKYTLAEGDVLRQAMGKKDAKQMEKERKKFKEGAISNEITESLATEIFDKIEKFASYGFNKSHAAAYGYLTYVTAYLKANYPRHWMAALMTCDRDDVSKVAKFIRECQVMEIAILPPDVNTSDRVFTASAQGVQFALTAIKGVGATVVDELIKNRDLKGQYQSLYEFIERVDQKKIGKKTIEYLVEAGCFDFTNWSRDQLKSSVEVMYDTAAKEKKEKIAGVMSLFSLLEEEKQFIHPPQLSHETAKETVLIKEKELLGFFLTGHPLKEHEKLIQRLGCIKLKQAIGTSGMVRVAFLIDDIQIKIASRTQKKFAILRITDQEDHVEVLVWSDFYEQKKELLEENKILFGVIQVDQKDGIRRLALKWCEELSKMDEEAIQQADRLYDRLQSQMKQGYRMTTEKKQKILMRINLQTMHLSDVLSLKEILKQFPGKYSIELAFFNGEKKEVTLCLSESINGSNSCLQEIKKIASVIEIEKS